MNSKTNLLVAGMLLVAVANAVGQPMITSQPQSRTNVVGSENQVIVPNSVGTQFYRLR